MNSMIACCGLNCGECPAFLATRKNDDTAREEVAALWKQQFHMDLSAGDINCDGCLSDTGRLFAHCRTCEIKKCCTGKGMENCAQCGDYPCEKLNAFFAFMPDAKARLEELKKKCHKDAS